MSLCGKNVEHICLQSLIRLGVSCAQVPQLEHRPMAGSSVHLGLLYTASLGCEGQGDHAKMKLMLPAVLK